MLQFWNIERGLFLESELLGVKLNTKLLFEFIVETPKEKGKRKEQKSPSERAVPMIGCFNHCYSLFFSLKNLCEGKRKEKGRKNWRREKVPTTLFLYIILSYLFKRRRLYFVSWYPISKMLFFPLILSQKNPQEQNRKDKRRKRRWLKVRYIHYFDIYEHVLVEHPNICSVKPAIINNGNRFRWRPMGWVRLQQRPIIALSMEWNLETDFQKNYDVTYLCISFVCLTYMFPYFVQKQEAKHKNVTNKLCFHDVCLLPINHISINNVKKNDNNMTQCCWESAALSRRRRFILPIVWVARDVCDFMMVSYQVLNSPRLIYYFSNMTLLFEFIVETPKEKGKRKKQKSPESDEGTHLVAEPFCFVKPII